MERVQRYAEEVNGLTINDFLPDEGWSEQFNREWIQQMREEGREIIDIGPDFRRRLDRYNRGLRPDSPFYNLERRALRGYERRYQVFERFGRFYGGVRGFPANPLFHRDMELRMVERSEKIVRVFMESVQEAFSQVSKLYHLRGPVVVKQSPLHVEIGCIGERLSIILALDVRDGIVDCQVRQMINGAPATYGQGRQEYLYTLLLRKGVPKEEIKIEILKNSSTAEQVRRMVKHCAYLLHKYGSKILASDL